MTPELSDLERFGLRTGARLFRHGEPLPIRHVSDLLRHLGVANADRAAQAAAVEAWLETNTPHRVVQAGLRRLGLPTERRSQASAA
ncbi:MAG: hypothetical protein KJ051_09685 [Thermoleophilia bacterium]|nr:hypothetical protein [Thermoleophilia bacterium]